MLACRSRTPVTAVAALGLLALLALSCGGGGSPSSSTPPTTVTRPAHAECADRRGRSERLQLPYRQGQRQRRVRARAPPGCRTPCITAIDALVQQRPQIFDKTQEAGAGTGQYLVLDKEAYLNGLVANLTAAGFCAQRDPDDFNYERIQAKNENGFSETFDVLLGRRLPADETASTRRPARPRPSRSTAATCRPRAAAAARRTRRRSTA